MNKSFFRPNRFGRFQVPPIRLILILNAIRNPSLLLLSQSRAFYAWKDKRGPAAHSRVTLSPTFVRTSSPCFNSIGNLFEEEALRELEPGEHVVRLSYLPWFEWVFAVKKKNLHQWMKDVAIARTCLVRPSESDMFLLSEQWQRRLAASIQPKPYPLLYCVYLALLAHLLLF